MHHPNLHVGLSGIVLPIPKYKFPEEFQKGSRMIYYASFFNSLEVNSSFYALPQKRTVERWANEVPRDFKFTFKLSRDITHQKDLVYEEKLIGDFYQTVNAIGEKKGCVLIQFPPSFKSSNFPAFEKLLHLVVEANTDALWKLAVEFRDSKWYNDDVYDLLRSKNVSLVLQDIPKSAAPFILTSDDFVYVRFHGPTGNYRGSYSEAFLQEYAEYITEWLNDGKTVYVYFNNTAGSAFDNLRTLQQFLLT